MGKSSKGIPPLNTPLPDMTASRPCNKDTGVTVRLALWGDIYAVGPNGDGSTVALAGLDPLPPRHTHHAAP